MEQKVRKGYRKQPERILKPVSLNLEKDRDVIEAVKQIKNFSAWVKDMVRKELM